MFFNVFYLQKQRTFLYLPISEFLGFMYNDEICFLSIRDKKLTLTF